MRTGREFLESLRDGRAVYLDGERVTDVTSHPAFAEPVRQVAAMYDRGSAHAFTARHAAPGEALDHLRSPGAPARVVDPGLRCGYSNYTMVRRGTGSRRRSAHSLEFKVVPIGNSRGVRLPKAVLDKYAIRDAVVVEEREEGLLLRSKKDRRLSWEETFKAMAYEREDWSDLDGTLNDGLDKEPW